jgi:ABC-type glycerol-3-phosphate transport system substrate-binding protein
MEMNNLSRRNFLRYGAGAMVGAAVLPALARPSAAWAEASRHAGSAGSYSYTMWSYDNPPQVAQMKQYVAGFNKTGASKLSFNISTLAGSGATVYPSKIQSLISSGKEPDMFRNWVGTLASPFVTEGAVLPLTDWYQKYKWDKILNPTAVQYVTFDGKPYGVPTSLDTIAMWYNKKLFAKAGVSVPTTYDEWEKVNATLLKAGVTPAAEAAIDGWDVMRLFEHFLEVTAGPALHDKLLLLQSSWNTPAVVEAFAMLKKWSDTGWLEKGWLGTNPTDSADLFAAGKAAQNLEGPWMALQIKATGANLDDFDLFAAPGDKGPARLAGFAQQYMIGKQVSGARLDALGEYWNWFVQPAQSKKYFYDGSTATNGGLPTGNSQVDKLGQKSWDVQKYGGYLIQDEALGTALANVYFSLQQGVGGGTVTPKDAAQHMQAAINKQMKK